MSDIRKHPGLPDSLCIILDGEKRMNHTTYFAVGRCQHGSGGCQEAKMFGQRAMILSPDFDMLGALESWLTNKAARPAERRCRNCNHPIPIRHFERRIVDNYGHIEIILEHPSALL